MLSRRGCEGELKQLQNVKVDFMQPLIKDAIDWNLDSNN